MAKVTAFKDEELIELFLDSKLSQGCTMKTIKVYRDNLILFKRFLKVPLLEANQFQINTFLAEKREKVAPASIHQYYRVLKTFYRWCVMQELAHDNPILKVPQPKIPHKVLPVFSREDLVKILDNCGTSEFLKVRNKAILLLILDSGIRRTEITSIQLKDVDFNSNTIRIHGKGQKERDIGFSNETRLALRKYLLYHQREEKCLWLSEEGRELQPRGIGSIFQQLRDRLGIKDVRCSPHTLRHTFACLFLENGGSIEALQRLMGHANLKSTEIYIENVRTKQALSEHTKASPVMNLRRRL